MSVLHLIPQTSNYLPSFRVGHEFMVNDSILRLLMNPMCPYIFIADPCFLYRVFAIQKDDIPCFEKYSQMTFIT